MQALLIDVDTDSDLDIYLVATDHDSVGCVIPADQLWLNDGVGQFTDVTFSNLPQNRGFALNAASGYFNADSMVDIVVLGTPSPLPHPLQLLYNDGSGIFLDSTGAHLPPDTLGLTIAVAAFDATGNGRDDILGIGTTTGLAFYRNTGGDFVREDFRFPSVPPLAFRGALTADFDGNNSIDVFLFGIFGNANRLLMNNGSGFFTDETAVRLPAFPPAHTNLGTVVDVDGDGGKDIFLPTVQLGQNSYDRLLVNNGTGYFGDGSNRLPNNVDFSVGSAAGNISGDGFDDILVANNKPTSGHPAQQDLLYINSKVITSVASPPIPVVFSLSQNYPNPFNPSTIIEFSVQHKVFTSLRVYDLLGREVATLVHGELRPGVYEANFDGKDLSSGVYFYRLQAGVFVQTRKLLLQR